MIEMVRGCGAIFIKRSIWSTPLRRPLAVLFPGQGSQHVGMGQDLAASYPTARRVFDEVEATLKFKLTRVMFEGPPEKLKLTCHAQPAILTLSYILTLLLKEQAHFDVLEHAKYALGHSLGEYTALLVAESITLSEAVALVHKRGLAMQEGLPTNLKTSMVALSMRADQISNLLEFVKGVQDDLAPGEVVDLSNLNSSFQAVLSGTQEAVERTCQMLQHANIAARAVELPVSAPFHCRLMEPAAHAMKKHLESIHFKPPKIPIISNVTATPMTEPEQIKDQLRKQMTGTVQWYPSIQLVRNTAAIQDWLVFGPNKALASLVKKDFPSDRVRLVECAKHILPVLDAS